MKLRMPPELREKIEGAADVEKRSLNAEIVHRLEESFTVDPDDGVLLSAEEAFKSAMKYRKLKAVVVRNYVIEEINDAVMSGRDQAYIDLERNCNLDAADESLYIEIVRPLVDELEGNGYRVDDFDGSNFVIYFNHS